MCGEFVAEVFASLKRKDQRGWGDCYLRGLMLDGRRKSIQPMAERLPDGNMQALQPFVSQSTWDHVPVLRAVAAKVTAAICPEARVIDDTSFPKAGDRSAGAARQWCGTLGKKSLCQVGVSLHAVTDAASVPLNWRFFLPAEWAGPDDGRRAKAGVPDGVGHRERWRLALDAMDEALGWGLTGQVVVLPRAGPVLEGPGHDRRTAPAAALHLARQGSKGAMTSRFIVIGVRPAGVAATKTAREEASGRGRSRAGPGRLPGTTVRRPSVSGVARSGDGERHGRR